MVYQKLTVCNCKGARYIKRWLTFVRISGSRHTGQAAPPHRNIQTVYKCKDCKDCPYKNECIKGNNCKTPMEERTKTLQVAKTFLKHRKEDLERILSEEGILFRTNRSIQPKVPT